MFMKHPEGCFLLSEVGENGRRETLWTGVLKLGEAKTMFWANLLSP